MENKTSVIQTKEDLVRYELNTLDLVTLKVIIPPNINTKMLNRIRSES